MQQAALMLSVMLSVTIVSQFSGMNTPVASLTGASYVIAHFLPLMYYNDVIEGAFLKGIGASALWWDAVVVAIYSVIGVAAGYLLFHKRTRA